MPRLIVLPLTEEEPPKSPRCAVAALNAKRGDRASFVVTNSFLVFDGPSRTGSAGCLCLKPQSQRRNPRPTADLRVCLVLRLKPTVGGIIDARERRVSPRSRFSRAPLFSSSGGRAIHVLCLNVSERDHD